MIRDLDLISKALGVLLPLWRARQLTSTAVIAYFYLVGVSDEEGNGHVRYFDMQVDFGRGERCCRNCMESLRRSGLIDGAHADGQGGAPFALSAFSHNSDGENSQLFARRSTAGNVFAK